jgi:hypothetical protein
MTDIIHYYTVENIISRKVNNEYKLDNGIICILESLKKLILVPDLNGSHTTRKPDRVVERYNHKNVGNGKNRRNLNGQSNRNSSSRDNLSNMMDDWEEIRNFKATEQKVAVGFENDLNNIRSLLNKLSSTNYNIQKDIIIDNIKIITTTESESDGYSENTVKVANMIFNIASANRFLSDLYSDLYSELVKTYSIFGEILNQLSDKYQKSMMIISYIDPNVDYDKFCDYNKENELRRASAAFIMNLTKRDLISRDDTVRIITELQSLTIQLINDDNRKNEVDEITENMFILFTMGKTFLTDHALWTSEIEPFIREFSKKKAKDYKSLSSRCIFKYMDMIGK